MYMLHFHAQHGQIGRGSGLWRVLCCAPALPTARYCLGVVCCYVSVHVSVLFTHLFSILHLFVFVHDSVLVVRVRRAGVT